VVNGIPRAITSCAAADRLSIGLLVHVGCQRGPSISLKLSLVTGIAHAKLPYYAPVSSSRPLKIPTYDAWQYGWTIFKINGKVPFMEDLFYFCPSIIFYSLYCRRV
jgi:hypothetical protein